MRCKKESCQNETVKIGKVYLKSDRKYAQRYRCKVCKTTFLSGANTLKNPKEKRYSLRLQVQKLYCIGTTLRDIAKTLEISRKTVARKLDDLAFECEKKVKDEKFKFINMPHKENNPIFVFDEVETYEHTKVKPISIGIVFDFRNNQIISMKTATFKARGRYAFIFFKDPIKMSEYKKIKENRPDTRQDMIIDSFKAIKSYLEGSPHIPTIITDGKRAYLTAIKEAFGNSPYHHVIIENKDLKKLKIESINNDFVKAKFSYESFVGTMRAKLSRLSRATFIHTKQIDWLNKTLFVYQDFWNQRH